MERQATTPDFYRYRWHGLSSAGVDGHFIELRWPDGKTHRAFDLWLYENVVGRSIDEATRESVLDPAQLDLSVTAGEVSLTDDGALRIVWEPDSDRRFEAVYHPGWLRHVADGHHLPSSGLPDQRPWRSDDLVEPPTHDGPTVMADGDAMDRWVDDLLRYGIARLRRLPLDPDLALSLAGRLGAVRDTNFGPIWDVKAEVDPGSTANTNYRLCPHTDLPTRETPPGFQFLHCIANTVSGGHSTMADGLAVVDHLRTEHPDHYRALTTLKWVFFNRGASVDHRWSGPIIDLGVAGSPLTLRAFHPVRGFPDMAEADLPRAYAALHCFATVAADSRFQLRYPMAPGDLVGFDNRRILHGRDGYGSDGHRHLRGLYIDHDEIKSFARMAARRRADRP